MGAAGPNPQAVLRPKRSLDRPMALRLSANRSRTGARRGLTRTMISLTNLPAEAEAEAAVVVLTTVLVLARTTRSSR
jgi:hypothetical protein